MPARKSSYPPGELSAPVSVFDVSDPVNDLRSTINSPKVLELSGIGQPEVLRKIGVPVRVDLPGVGENVQDHLISGAYSCPIAHWNLLGY